MTRDDLARLRAAAEAATPGPWEHFHDPDWERDAVVRDSEKNELLELDLSNNMENDAAFIAAANPAAVLTLIAELASVRRLAEEACELAREGYSRGWDRLDRQDAETRIAAIREDLSKRASTRWTKVRIDRDRDGWFWFVPRDDGKPIPEADKSARARTYDEIIAHASLAGYQIDNAGWKQRLLSWNWNYVALDRYPGWAIEDGTPPWCHIRHVNGDTWRGGKRVSDEPATRSSKEVISAWDDIAEVQFYARDISYDGSCSVCNGEAYGSLWWFRTAKERGRFLAWLADFAPTCRVVYRNAAEFNRKESK